MEEDRKRKLIGIGREREREKEVRENKGSMVMEANSREKGKRKNIFRYKKIDHLGKPSQANACVGGQEEMRL